MFAVIKKNEGLAKVIDAPSLKAAYDKLMYSEKDVLEPGNYQLINDQNPEMRFWCLITSRGTFNG